MTKQNLWAPWRIGYLQELGGDKPPGRAGDCFLCAAGEIDLSDDDAADRLVLRRTPHATLLLNRYPYSNGHLLVSPHDHVAELSDMTPPGRAGLIELCDLGARLLKAAVNPQGVNIGANLGRAAGAGVPGHLHFHVVPRWAGDCNFMDVVAGTRVIPQALGESYRVLKDAIEKMD